MPKRPYTLPYNGKNVMVVGLGPAGYTLAHYLLNEGFGVIGIDGLKIEPLPTEWTGKPRQIVSETDQGHRRDHRKPRRTHSVGFWRRFGIRHHGPLGQEFSDDDPADADAAQAVSVRTAASDLAER